MFHSSKLKIPRTLTKHNGMENAQINPETCCRSFVFDAPAGRSVTTATRR